MHMFSKKIFRKNKRKSAWAKSRVRKSIKNKKPPFKNLKFNLNKETRKEHELW